MASIKMKAKEKKGVVTVKALITHPMETGLRKDKKTGQVVPAHFINEVKAEVGGETVLTCLWSGGISKNPYLSFEYLGSKGDELKLTWADNMGKGDSKVAKVK